METEDAHIALYRWGRWVWYYRALALIVYGTGLTVVVGIVFPIMELVAAPTIANVVIVVLVVALFLLWGLWAWVTWRDGQARAVLIVLDPSQELLLVRTLNFGTRRVPLAAIGPVEYSATQRYMTTAGGSSRFYEPTLIVAVQNDAPIRVDMQGHIVDKDCFKSILQFDVENKVVLGRGRRGGRVVQ